MAKRPRRAPGEGSVYKDKHGQWWASLTLANGRRKTVRCPQGENTERKARQLLKQLQQQHEAGVDLTAGRTTVQNLLQRWLNETVGPRVKVSTFASYRYLIEAVILPELGAMRLDRLTADDVEQWLNSLAEAYADTVRKNAYGVLCRALDVAVRRGHVARNVARLIEPPKVKRTPITALSLHDSRRILEVVESHRLATLYHVALLLGLREGEVLGLRWMDVDWDQATITIAQQVQAIEGVLQFGTPKSESSRRTVPLPPLLLERLRYHWQRQQDERLERGVTWREHGLIFASKVGTPIHPRNLVRHFKAVLIAAGFFTIEKIMHSDGKERQEKKALPIPFHNLRHTAATRMADVGAPEAIIGALLGHTGGSVTRRYTHATAESMRSWVVKVEQELNRRAA
jgi:integrase